MLLTIATSFVAGICFASVVIVFILSRIDRNITPDKVTPGQVAGPYRPPITVNIWRDKAGEYRWKAGFEVVGTLDEVDWKCDSTEGFDTEAEAFHNMEVFVCRAYEAYLTGDNSSE